MRTNRLRTTSQNYLRTSLGRGLRKATLSRSTAGLFTGFIEGRPLHLSPRDRSLHSIFIGGPGSGKTTAFDVMGRQDIRAARGCTVIDPMGALYKRLVAYSCYCRAIGVRLPEVILWNPSDGDWVLPFNPFIRKPGDISVQVDRRVSAILRAWGHDPNDTPRLEKWLKVFCTVIFERPDLSIVEMRYLLDQQAVDVRNFLIAGLKDPLIARMLEQLGACKPAEFREQTESVENRLMRFLCSDTLRRTMGVGTNALDFPAILDEGKILLVNLNPSNWLSLEQRRLIGSLLITEFYEAALSRPSGSKPHYLYIDEAANFVTEEIGMALEQCRQKGLHFTLAFQHLSQFKEESMRLYKAVKNSARNKFVFAIPDRPDAQELADDIFVGLAEPRLKFMHRRLNHRLEDIRETSITQNEGESNSWGRTNTHSEGKSNSEGNSQGGSRGRNQTVGTTRGQSRTFNRGKTTQKTKGTTHTHTENESHASNYSESMDRQEAWGNNSAEAIHHGKEDDTRAETTGRSYNSSSGYSHTAGGSDNYQSGDSESETQSESSAANTNVAWARNRQLSKTQGKSLEASWQANCSKTASASDSHGQNVQYGKNRSRSVTDQPGTRHIPFMEEDPEHWTLEEQRWRASELLMRQPTGHNFVSTSAVIGAVTWPKPAPFYIRRQQLVNLRQGLYEKHCLRGDKAEEILTQRQARLIAQVESAARNGDSRALNSGNVRQKTPTEIHSQGIPNPPANSSLKPQESRVRPRWHELDKPKKET